MCAQETTYGGADLTTGREALLKELKRVVTKGQTDTTDCSTSPLTPSVIKWS